MNVPEFWKKIEGGTCSYAWTKKWMPKAYTLIWRVFFGLSFMLMTGLYSRVIYALWFKNASNSEVVNRRKVWFDSPYGQCRSFTRPLCFNELYLSLTIFYPLMHYNKQIYVCGCPKPILWSLNSILIQTFSFFPINLHTCWPREWKQSIDNYATTSS